MPQSRHSAVAVGEWMYEYELVVEYGREYQRMYCRVSFAHPCEQAFHQLRDKPRWRSHEYPAVSAEDAFFATYQEPDILQEVPALTEAERAALQCRFRFAPYDDGEDLMTYEQIGHTLGISTTLAHRHVQRGLKKVREALQP